MTYRSWLCFPVAAVVIACGDDPTNGSRGDAGSDVAITSRADAGNDGPPAFPACEQIQVTVPVRTADGRATIDAVEVTGLKRCVVSAPACTPTQFSSAAGAAAARRPCAELSLIVLAGGCDVVFDSVDGEVDRATIRVSSTNETVHRCEARPGQVVEEKRTIATPSQIVVHFGRCAADGGAADASATGCADAAAHD